jgi:hypothetical protein
MAYTRQELKDKVEYEGSVYAVVVEYGIPPEDLPADTPKIVRQSWERVFGMTDDVFIIQHWLDGA